ncbi:MAG: flagellin [Rhodospirillales bacterium]|nr:flagellin [Rhodospirillales bacterium]
MADITLSNAVRSSLLSLQNTTQLINRTQNRLSTGLEVAGPIDDPVKFFQAKTLSDRATDFDDKKSGIDQGISTLTAAIDGAEGIENIVSQMKGLALSAKSATSSTIAELVSQFNDLRTQIANLASDTTYQGQNLVNGTGTTLTVNFSTDTTSTLAVASVDISEGGDGLAIRQVLTQAEQSGAVVNVSYAFGTTTSLTIADTMSITFANQSAFTFGSQGLYTFAYGTVDVGISVGSVGGAASASTFALTQVLAAGTTLTLTIGSALDVQENDVLLSGADSVGVSATVGTVTGQYIVDSTLTNQINTLVNSLDSALTTLRTKSQTLGSNVALLQTRLDFTESYVNTLQGGADKLTLADLNEEGANLLALQTRQQLGISALSFAGQAEQGILALFR